MESCVSSEERGAFPGDEKMREHVAEIRGAADMALEQIEDHLWHLETWLGLFEKYDEILGGFSHLKSSAAARGNLIEEIEKCRNQREGLRFAAEMNGGVVRVRDIARMIHGSSLSRGSLSSIRSALLRYVKESDEWVPLGDGYYRLVGEGRAVEPRYRGMSSLRPRLSKAVAKARALRREAEVPDGEDVAGDA